MNAEQFKRASAVFLEARQRSAADREAFIRSECAGDEPLRRAVENLVRNDAAPDAGLHTLAVGAAIGQAASEVFEAATHGSTNGDSHQPITGRHIGGYRLIRKIGEGGMGTVYEAQQDNPSRVVALKIIRPGLASPATLRRFQHEVQVLGRLQHPGIAQIYEAGMDDTGEGAQPYFAMEFVGGPPLNVYVDHNRLGTRQRLELMAKICDAVEHAHQKGVIHRDLKPGNILIVSDGTEGPRHPAIEASRHQGAGLQPKILDFGVARAIDSDVHTTTMRTDVGQLIGTVSYMSPEQAAADPNELDTRSDVYALGVVCYELLADRLPYDLAKRPIPEAMRIIGHDDPTPLSVINRVFRGDVETVIAKALEKEKSRRYQSAAEFAADIRRYLHDEPIVARPASAAYQIRKFARRNKILVGGIAAVFVALVLGIIGTGIGLSRALEEAHRATKMNAYLGGMLEFLDPSEVQGKEITLRQMLDEAARRLDAEMADEPRVAADLHDTIGRGYERLGANDAAQLHLERALAMRTELLGADSLLVADTLASLGNVFRNTARPEQAAEAFERELAIRSLRSAPLDSARVQTLVELAHTRQTLNQDDRVAALKAQVIAVGRQAFDQRTPDAAMALESVGNLLQELSDFDAAEPLYRRAILIRKDLGQWESERVCVLHRNLADLLMSQHRLDEALEMSRVAMDLGKRLHVTLDRNMMISQLNMVFVLRARGDIAAALPLALELLDANLKLYGEDHAETAAARANLSVLYLETDQFEQAEPYARQALETLRRLNPENLTLIAQYEGAWGLSLLGLGRAKEAESLLRQALETRSKMLPANHTSLANLKSNIGEALLLQGRTQEAEPLLLEGYQGLDQVDVMPIRFRKAAERVIRLYESTGRGELAQPYRDRLAILSPGK